MALPPTPWIQAPDTAGNYLKGYSLGQQADAEQARLAASHAQLQQQAQQSQMEMEVKQKQFEQESMLQQQKMEIEKAYRQQEISLGQQKLQEQAKISQSKIQDAARKNMVMMQAQKEIDSGSDPVGVWSKYGPQLYGAGGSGYVKAYADQQRRASLPAQQSPAEKAMMAVDVDTLKTLTDAIIKKKDEISLAKESVKPALNADLEALLRQKFNTQSNLGRLHGTGAASTSASPAASAPSASTATAGAAPVIAGRWTPDGGLVLRKNPQSSNPTSSVGAGEVQPLFQGSTQAPTASLPDSLQAPASGGDLSQFQDQKAPASTPTPTQETQAEPSKQLPVAPQKTEDRQFGQVYLVKDGPYKGMTMKWEKDDWGHGVWEQVETPAPEWIRKSGEAVGGTLKKAYKGLTSHWGD